MPAHFIRKAFTVLCALMLSGCSGAKLLDMVTPYNGYTLMPDIAYNNGPMRKMDVYLPSRPAASACAVFFLYGGSWQSGHKDIYRFVGQALATEGCVTAIPDYRQYPSVKYPDFLTDSADAFVYFYRHAREYSVNPENIFILGHSAGAYNALMITLDKTYLKKAGGSTDWVRGVIGLAGPYDFLPFTDPKVKDIFSTAPDSKTQPINYAHAQMPPLLLATGADDTEVYPKNTYNLAKALQDLGNDVSVITYPKTDHVGAVLPLSVPFRKSTPALKDIMDFIAAKQSTP